MRKYSNNHARFNENSERGASNIGKEKSNNTFNKPKVLSAKYFLFKLVQIIII